MKVLNNWFVDNVMPLLTPTETVIATYVARHEPAPLGIERIMDGTGLSKKTVIDALAELADLNVLECTERATNGRIWKTGLPDLERLTRRRQELQEKHRAMTAAGRVASLKKRGAK